MSSAMVGLGQRSTHPTSISLERPLIEAAQARAKARRQSFSAYVATLLEADLAREAAASGEEVGS